MDFRHTSPSEKMKVLQHNTAWLNNSWKGRVAVSRSHSMFSFTQRSRHLSHQANSRCVWGSQMPALPSSWQIIFSISVSVLADGWCWSYRVLTHSTCQTIKFSCQRLTGPCPRGLTSLTTSYVWSDKLCWASSDTSIYTNKLLTFADLAKKVGYLIILLEHDKACIESIFPELLAQEIRIKHLFLLDISYFIVYSNIKVLRNNS